jgi:hypothetical protein
MHQSSLKINIIKALGHAEDRFYAKYDEGQDGKSDSQGDSHPAWLGSTKPVQQAKPKQGRNDQKCGRVGKSLKEPNSE